MIEDFLRRVFRLRDLLNFDDDELEGQLAAVLALAAWHYRGKRGDEIDHTTALSGLDVTRQNLILHLSTFDVQFRVLAVRLATGSLLRKSPPPSRIELLFAADLLNSDRRPKARSLVARNALYVIAVRISIEQGRKPTGDSKLRREDSEKLVSACEYVSARLEKNFNISTSYSVIEDAWKKRSKCLEDANFPAEQISDFLGKYIR